MPSSPSAPERPRDCEARRRDAEIAAKHSPKQWIYRNLTPWRIEACFHDEGHLMVRSRRGTEDAGKVLAIPALGEVVVPAEDARMFDTLNMRRLGQIELRPAPSAFLSNLPRAVVIYGWLAVGLWITLHALLGGGGTAVPWRRCAAVAILIPVLALLIATWREIRLYRRFGRYRADLGRTLERRGVSLEGVAHGGRIRTFIDGVPRHAAEAAVLVGALAISIIGLGLAIHLTTQLNELMPIDLGALAQLDDAVAGLDDLARTSPAFWQLLVGHVAQWVLVSIAAIVPAAMYFQFDRQRLSAIQRQWIQEVFRLDSTVRTVRDIEAKYGAQIEASFGDLDPDSGLRLGRGRRSPVIVCTILLVVGWFLVISTTEVPLLVPDEGATRLVWPGADFPVASFFRPELTLVGYAFLGAYVFGLLHVIRGYQRRDLHPKTYNTIVVRILAAYALALVVSVVYDGPFAEVVMFSVGFMPQSALVWLREQVAQDSGPWKTIPLHEPAPLTELEGIDLYDRTRLAEEGINNVEALAHADIIDLMSSTRIAAAELVDWTDQALLYLKVGGDVLDRTPRAPVQGTAAGSDEAASTPVVRRNLGHLRRFGIRTATDLVQAYQQALQRGGRDDEAARAEVRLLRSALALPSDPAGAPVPPIQVIIDTLPDEEWFVQVRNWRDPEFGAVASWYRYLDGHDWEVQQAKVPSRVRDAGQPLAAVPVVDEHPIDLASVRAARRAAPAPTAGRVEEDDASA